MRRHASRPSSSTSASPSGATRAADIYCLGLVLYHMVTGQYPFVSGRENREILAQHVHGKSTPPSRLDPTVPAALSRIIVRCMAKLPSARYASAAELEADLAEVSPSKTVAELEEQEPAPPPPQPARAVLPPAPPAPSPPPRSRSPGRPPEPSGHLSPCLGPGCPDRDR